jgi:pimeloyl-ACP methyl ester carboxylesterase
VRTTFSKRILGLFINHLINFKSLWLSLNTRATATLTPWPKRWYCSLSRVFVRAGGLAARAHRERGGGRGEQVKDGFRVVAVDMPGRWNSERIPAANYSYPQYIHDVKTLVHHLGVKKIDWLGTSMGGLIGMLVAAQQDPQGMHLFRRTFFFTFLFFIII